MFGEDAVPDLLEAGIDCLEHGTGLLPDTVDAMANAGVRLVPTLINIENFPTFADAADRYPAYAKHMRDLYERSDTTIGSAIEAGVAVHAGTDAGGFVEHGRIVDEIAALTRVGMSPGVALEAASHAARAWLGAPGQQPGEPADLVVYAADPAGPDGVDVLRSPTAVIRAGRRVPDHPNRAPTS